MLQPVSGPRQPHLWVPTVATAIHFTPPPSHTLFPLPGVLFLPSLATDHSPSSNVIFSIKLFPVGTFLWGPTIFPAATKVFTILDFPLILVSATLRSSWCDPQQKGPYLICLFLSRKASGCTEWMNGCVMSNIVGKALSWVIFDSHVKPLVKHLFSASARSKPMRWHDFRKSISILQSWKQSLGLNDLVKTM